MYTLITKIFLYENRSFSLGIDIIKVEFLLSKSIVYLHRKKRTYLPQKIYIFVILLYFVLYLNSASEECLLFGFIFRELILFTLESIFRLCRFENNKKNTYTHTHLWRKKKFIVFTHIHNNFLCHWWQITEKQNKIFHRIYILGGFVVFSEVSRAKVGSQKI